MRFAAFSAAVLPAALLFASRAQAAQARALWRVVHDLCVPDRRLTGFAAPCLSVDLKAGFAVVPNPGEALDVVVVPTARMVGIEDPKLQSAGTPNYWRLAWAERARLDRRLQAALPRTAVGMAVNAASGRSQDQLHIHLSCVRQDVASALGAAPRAPRSGWSTLLIDGRPWRVRTLEDADLSTDDPFKLLASEEAPRDLGRETLVVIGADLPAAGPGFYLLHRAGEGLDPDDVGHGEALLDERCAHLAPAGQHAGP